MNRIHATALAMVALVALRGEDGGCDSSIVGDPTFDLWCGAKLCAWDVEDGEIERVPTWHRSDYGAELRGDPVVLSQEATISSWDARCLEFRLQADHEDGVNLRLQVDLFADRTVDHDQPVASDGYRQVTFRLATPGYYRGVRFVIRKGGRGRAVLAELKIKTVDAAECEGAVAIELSTPIPDGIPCERSDQCDSDRCVDVRQMSETIDWSDDNLQGGTIAVCGECRDDGDCTDGRVCGLEVDPSNVHYLHRGCVAAGSALLGDRCAIDAECATGSCCEGVCSQCCPEGEVCPAGQCELLQLSDEHAQQLMPRLCSPGQGLGAAGAPCVRDSDCESGSCSGGPALKVCILDGRRCASEAQCPYWPHACLEMGPADGRCD